ncbi:copper amine oxidase N-terminal domain-containing protein [Ammoniphilus sp. CFH 90114]|uniref:copper amine oxidase N-terminal domain-containing protein n=1 Tax=Ammoniphilus sp. CFH 90114 TaxID=2493665 RepID=UPI00100DB46E|nr:copper amine oxidase N-terminal domain-containing protein [Ammoniphilus sp. CFH 90114]RXT02314.1 copper amine oxidase N-terminal domain-containing protein [Ammoniphilus sp. CFH 90114]
MKIRWLIPLFLLFLLSQTVLAAQTIKLIVNHKEIKPDVPPQLVNGRVLVPVRSVAEALQAEVIWDELSQSVTITQKQPTPEQINSLPEAKAGLFAIERDGMYEKFELRVGDKVRKFPFWNASVSRPHQMLFHDIDEDGQKEIIVLLTTSTGNGIHITEAHVIKTGDMLQEVYVEQPLAITWKNVSTKSSPGNMEIRVGKEKHMISKEKVSSPPENWFPHLHFGNQISYNIVDNKLTAFVSGQISPTEYVGEVVITYEYKDMMFQSTDIDYRPLSSSTNDE